MELSLLSWKRFFNNGIPCCGNSKGEDPDNFDPTKALVVKCVWCGKSFLIMPDTVVVHASEFWNEFVAGGLL